jgi:hypothetical protein
MSPPASNATSANTTLVAERTGEGGLRRRGNTGDPRAWEKAMEEALHSASFGTISPTDSPPKSSGGALRAGGARAGSLPAAAYLKARARDGLSPESSRRETEASTSAGKEPLNARMHTPALERTGPAAENGAHGRGGPGRSAEGGESGPLDSIRGWQVNQPGAPAQAQATSDLRPTAPMTVRAAGELAWAGLPPGNETLARTAPEEASEAPRPARERPLGAAVLQRREPVRWHAEWTSDGLRLWLGADHDSSLALPHLTALVLRELEPWLDARGARLLSLVCNGQTVWECPPRQQPAEAVTAGMKGCGQSASALDVGDVLSRISFDPKEVP